MRPDIQNLLYKLCTMGFRKCCFLFCGRNYCHPATPTWFHFPDRWSWWIHRPVPCSGSSPLTHEYQHSINIMESPRSMCTVLFNPFVTFKGQIWHEWLLMSSITNFPQLSFAYVYCDNDPFSVYIEINSRLNTFLISAYLILTFIVRYGAPT